MHVCKTVFNAPEMVHVCLWIVWKAKKKMNLNFEEWQVSQPGELQVTSV